MNHEPTPTNELDTPSSKFIRILYGAYSASVAVDYFDLTSDPESQRKFNSLSAQQKEEFIRLVTFVRDNHEVIIQSIEDDAALEAA